MNKFIYSLSCLDRHRGWQDSVFREQFDGEGRKIDYQLLACFQGTDLLSEWESKLFPDRHNRISEVSSHVIRVQRGNNHPQHLFPFLHSGVVDVLYVDAMFLFQQPRGLCTCRSIANLMKGRRGTNDRGIPTSVHSESQYTHKCTHRYTNTHTLLLPTHMDWNDVARCLNSWNAGIHKSCVHLRDSGLLSSP